MPHAGISQGTGCPRNTGFGIRPVLFLNSLSLFFAEGRDYLPSKPGSFSFANLGTLQYDSRGQEDGRVKLQEGGKERAPGDPQLWAGRQETEI